MANYWTKSDTYKPKKAKPKKHGGSSKEYVTKTKAKSKASKVPKYLRGGSMRSGKK